MKRQQRRTKEKQKRALAKAGALSRAELSKMAREAHYESSDWHKAAPNGSSVPQHRPDKTVCRERDGRYPKAKRLLSVGFRRGMVSTEQHNGWPRYVWAVDATGAAYEGRLTNQGNGEYHGYPMVAESKFTKHVLAQWPERR